jgi:nitroreductase
MDFTKVIETRRSVRRYQNRNIPQNVLEKIMHAAVVAPTGQDTQTWHFFLVRDQDLKNRLVTEATTQKFIKKAPVIAVCCDDKREKVYKRDEVYLIDTVIAIDHMILAARNRGVGTCWVGSFDKEKVRKILNIPDHMEVHMLVPMGYPEKTGAFKEKKEKSRLESVYTIRIKDGF